MHVIPHHTRSLSGMRVLPLLIVLSMLPLSGARVLGQEPADVVLLDGKIITLDPQNRTVEAIALRGGVIVAVGDTAEIADLAGEQTRVIQLDGRCVAPGFIESHTHALGVARAELVTPWVELNSVSELQDWIRARAAELPAGRWIQAPRVDITRLAERRRPTPLELDAASASHPVSLNVANRTVLNSLGFKTVGVTAEHPTIPGGDVILDDDGQPLMIAGGSAHLRQFFPRPELGDEEVLTALKGVHAIYNSVGITSIFERAGRRADWDLYTRMKADGNLNVRTSMTIRQQFRSAEQVEPFTQELGLITGDGDDWLRVGPLKITVDGGIHWGNVRLSEPYGERRIEFYHLDDPEYRGDLRYSEELMAGIFAEATRLGWQCSCHVTGDGGVAAVLHALEAADRIAPLRDRRFNLIHAYFPDQDWLDLAHELGVGVDTQSWLYYRDSDAIASVYGPDWAARFIGLGSWLEHGVPVAINSDHMSGVDPDHAMNSFNPLLMLWIAVVRSNDRGDVHGPDQRLSRLDALRSVTRHPAWLCFDEDVKGTLEVGRFADLVVLDRDYLTCPADEIRNIQVDITMVDGRVVYETPASLSGR
jgi:predicted amidohydrolase YtcJ